MQFQVKLLFELFSKFHDRTGVYYETGSPEYLLSLHRERRRASIVGDNIAAGENLEALPAPLPAPPLCLAKFYEHLPDNVEKASSRNACCQKCLEIDEMLDLYVNCMIVLHGLETRNPLARSAFFSPTPGKSIACKDPDCPYVRHEVVLPSPCPSRLKNIITSSTMLRNLYKVADRPKHLYCGECECGSCGTRSAAAPMPAAAPSPNAAPLPAPSASPETACLRCRFVFDGEPERVCHECGLFKVFPQCPTFMGMASKKFPWRCLYSTKKAIMVAQDQDAGQAPALSYKLTDMLMNMRSKPSLFVSTLQEKLRAWGTHEFVHMHQLIARRKAIENVGRGPRGTRLVLLFDWADKLSLIPRNSTSCGRYPSVGVFVCLGMYRGLEETTTTTTYFVICESETGDVSQTQQALKNIMSVYTTKSRLMQTTLRRVDFFSDGGPKHHKNAESMLATIHLQEWLRECAIAGPYPASSADKKALQLLMARIELVWHLMQGNHGKGPYDAEGGILKVFVMHAVRDGGNALLTARDVFDWAKTCMPLLHPTVQNFAGSDAQRLLSSIHLPQFTIAQRMLHYVSDAECPRRLDGMKIKPLRLALPRGHEFPAESNPLTNLASAFCFRFGRFPSLSLEGHAPLAVGVPSTTQYTYDSSRSQSGHLEPYSPQALATAGTTRSTWVGQWRRWSCVCDVCAGLQDGQCASLGCGWYPWSIHTHLDPKCKILASIVGLSIATSAVWNMDAGEDLVSAKETLLTNIADKMIRVLARGFSLCGLERSSVGVLSRWLTLTLRAVSG